MHDASSTLPPVMLPDGRRVPDHALEERATTAGGPGGQHANKASTRVVLLLAIDRIGLGEEDLRLVRTRLGRRVSADGIVAVESRSHRSQLRNRVSARRRMTELLARALRREAARVPTKVSKAALRRRRKAKQRRSELKSSRRHPGVDRDA